MARRTIKINLQARNPEKFLTLCDDIIEQNTSLGASSPLADGQLVDMSDFAVLATKARQHREKALEYYALAEAEMEESRRLIGINDGQTVTTPGTLFFFATRIKKWLLALSPVNPKELSPWGFNVVVGEAKNPKRRKGTN